MSAEQVRSVGARPVSVLVRMADGRIATSDRELVIAQVGDAVCQRYRAVFVEPDAAGELGAAFVRPVLAGRTTQCGGAIDERYAIGEDGVVRSRVVIARPRPYHVGAVGEPHAPNCPAYLRTRVVIDRIGAE